MAALKQAFEAIGLYEVQTFIQSGNVLFKSNGGEEPLRAKIEHKITAAFGLSVTVIIRTAAELEQIILNCPFTQEKISAAESSSDAECFYAAFLSQIPSQEKVDSLKAYKVKTTSIK